MARATRANHSPGRPQPHVSVVGGGFAGLTAAITAAEAGARVTLYESHHTLGGRARTAEGAYKTNDGPHALYNGGPHWTWLKQRGLIGDLAPIPPIEGTRLRLRHRGALRRTPPFAMLRLLRRAPEQAPVDVDFATWAGAQVGEEGARAAAHYSAVALFHHDPGSLSARFVHTRLRRATRFPPEAHYPVGGWGAVIDRMAGMAWNLGVRVETLARVDDIGELAARGPVVVATSLDAARRLLGDDTLRWESGRTALVDVAVRTRRGDLFAVSDLDATGWVERFTAQDRTLAPAGEQLIQAQIPIGPGESKADGVARAEHLLDLGFRDWRERVTWRRAAVANGRTGALDRPGTTWRDRPAVDRGDGVYLAGDQVAAPGLLSEVSFNSAMEAVTLALTGRGGLAGMSRPADGAPWIDLKSA
ncbi:NAD(P)-binding protein [Streptomyces lasiicapitis]|uniref:NAD(P)-binding protein n=1 Tax=Streptomyces lasiicapitis TaxID=1923961 RepID=UPI0036CE6BB1